mgnify:CR=1 FL=1
MPVQVLYHTMLPPWFRDNGEGGGAAGPYVAPTIHIVDCPSDGSGEGKSEHRILYREGEEKSQYRKCEIFLGGPSPTNILRSFKII